MIKVVCINIGNTSMSIHPYPKGLTIGKVYEIDPIYGNSQKCRLIDDNGSNVIAFIERFIELDEYRSLQIDKVLL